MLLSLCVTFGAYAEDESTATAVASFKKWASYQNNQDKTVGEGLSYGTTNKDTWRYADKGDPDLNFATYQKDPKNDNNIVLRYAGGKYTSQGGETANNKVCNQINYMPTTEVSSTGGYSVEMKLLLPTAMNINKANTIRLYYEKTGETSDTYTIAAMKKTSEITDASGKTVSKFTLSLKPKDGNKVISTTQLQVVDGDWIDIKFVYDDQKLVFLANDVQYVSLDLTDEHTFKDIYYKDTAETVAGTDGSYTYIDDVKITDESTTDMVHFEDVATDYSYDLLQGESTENISVYKLVKLLNEDNSDSGYSVPLFAEAEADVSKLGTYNAAVYSTELGKNINITYNVLKMQEAFSENFQGYEESGIGNAPYISPFVAGSDTTGRTVEYEDDTKTNKLLKYTTSTQDNWGYFTENELIEGKVQVGFKIKLAAVGTNYSFFLPIMGKRDYSGTNVALIALYAKSDEKGGRLFFNEYGNDWNKETAQDGASDTTCESSTKGSNVMIVNTGELVQDTWYSLVFDIDLKNGTFTYSLNGTQANGTYNLAYKGYKLSQLRIAQRNTDKSITANSTMYYDDMFVNKYLSLDTPVETKLTVYKGEDVDYPENVNVTLSDGKTVAPAAVTWTENIRTDTPGSHTTTGAVEGMSETATLKVTVSEYPYEIIAPVIKSGDTEIFGIENGAAVSAVSVNKIAKAAVAGKAYVALYNAAGKLTATANAALTTDGWNAGETKDVAVTLNITVPENETADGYVLKTFILSDSLTPLCTANTFANTAVEGTPQIWMAGDSTMARYNNAQRPETGWGEALADIATSADITVQNGTIGGTGGVSGTGAIGGQSAKSYVDRGSLSTIVANAKAGDYLFIQFGHNDSSDEAYRHTEPETTYKEYLTTFVTTARENGMIPVLFTSIARGTYQGANSTFNGDTKASLDLYANAAKEVAAAYHVPVVDLHKKTSDVLKGITQEGSKKYFLYLNKCTAESEDDCTNSINGAKNHTLWCTNYPNGATDSTHLNFYGAAWVANMAVDGLNEIKLPLGKLLYNAKNNANE